ncbi:hypothetical protein [Domibacillus antri]|nr:hypothetical protein [Domibacillus antri]
MTKQLQVLEEELDPYVVKKIVEDALEHFVQIETDTDQIHSE